VKNQILGHFAEHAFPEQDLKQLFGSRSVDAQVGQDLRRAGTANLLISNAALI